MPRALRVCPVAGCPELTQGGRCAGHRQQAEQQRGSATQRGYGSQWAQRRAAFLARNPHCAICSGPATVADHYPVSRRDLVSQGVTDPDADHRLRPLCQSDHGRETQRHQPGGWNAR